MHQHPPFKCYFIYQINKLDGILKERQATDVNKNAWLTRVSPLSLDEIVIVAYDKFLVLV